MNAAGEPRRKFVPLTPEQEAACDRWKAQQDTWALEPRGDAPKPKGKL